MNTALPRTAWIGLGANLDHPPQQVLAAVAALAAQLDIKVTAVSSLYRSAPMGPADQPDYCNAVAQIDTELSPEALMERLLALERAAGRVRDHDRWGPRRLDLDLLSFAEVTRDTQYLRLPHPGIAQRAFVLVPWAEIAPEAVVPGLGRVTDVASLVNREGLQRLDHPEGSPWS